MQYKEKKYKDGVLVAEYDYLVTYDSAKLRELLSKLNRIKIISSNTVTLNKKVLFPTRDNILKELEKVIRKKGEHFKGTITGFSYKKEKDNIVVDYSLEKNTDLYHYIDIIIYGRNLFNYTGLFRKTMSQVTVDNDQILLDGILNYIDSKELDVDSFKNKSKENNDFKKLLEIYKEILKCFNFTLVSVKDYKQEEESTDGMSFQKKLLEGHFKLLDE